MKRTAFLLLLLSSNVYADNCDDLREKIQSVSDKCETGTKVTNGCGVIGTVLAPFTMGLSAAACLIPAATAEWICRHKDYLKTLLENCDSNSELGSWIKAYGEQKKAESEAYRVKGMSGYLSGYQGNLNNAKFVRENEIRVFQMNCGNLGFDTTHPDNAEYVDAVLMTIEAKYVYYLEWAEEEFHRGAMLWHTNEQRQALLKKYPANWPADKNTWKKYPPNLDLSCDVENNKQEL